MNTLDKYSELSVATCGDPTGVGASGSVIESETTDKTATPCRKYPRADFHDYNGGVYFVTVCTHDKCHYFGKIDDGKMFLSETGKALDEALRGCHEHFPDVEIPLFVVMPNHFHAIICVSSSASDTYRPHNHGRLNQLARLAVATCGDPTLVTHHGSRLAAVVVAIKSAVTRFARRNNIEFNWQSRYHDHIIRGNHDSNKITEYIKNNVARWADDCYNTNDCYNK